MAMYIHGHLEVVQLLLEVGTNKSTLTGALNVAATNGRLEIMSFLLKAGAAKGAARKHAEIALALVVQNGHQLLERVLEGHLGD